MMVQTAAQVQSEAQAQPVVPTAQPYHASNTKQKPIWLMPFIAAASLIMAIIISVIVYEDGTRSVIEDPFADVGPLVIELPSVEVPLAEEAPGTEEYPVAEEDPDDEDTETIERGTFTDFPVIVGEGTDFPLNAMISIPDNATGKVPAVVLVHGDGVFDMDEEIFGNKPFRDIAEYLASYGIAVIRYDKRNFKHAKKMEEMFNGGITAGETVIEDVLLALELIKNDPRVDEDRVFMLGHSFGGYIAPRIHIENGVFAGIISYAGTPLSYVDRAYYKVMDDIAIMPEGKEKEDEYEKWKNWDVEYRYYLYNTPDDELKSETWGEYPLYFFKDLENHPIPDYVMEATIPFLIIQGLDDFAVDVVHDYTAWQELFEGRDNATFKLYEGLNHFLFPSQGYEYEDWEKEYGAPGYTDEQVLADIVEWIYSN